MSDDTFMEPFSFNERLGLMFTAEGAILSLIAVIFILCYASVKWLKRYVITWGPRALSDTCATESSLFLNLMLADLLQAGGILPNLKWMIDAGITDGEMCRAQGLLKQIGIVGTSMSSLAITIHTFAVLILRWRPPKHASKFAVVVVWIVTAVIVGIPNAMQRSGPFYGPTGFWCWIRYEWKVERIATEYLWVWFCAFMMLILYTTMFAVMRGWIHIGKSLEEPQTFGYPNESVSSEPEEQPESAESKRTRAVARRMLYFPAVYIISVLPNSISRWSGFTGHQPTPSVVLFCNTIFALSGFFNFILFFSTRPGMVVGKNVAVRVVHLDKHRPRPTVFVLNSQTSYSTVVSGAETLTCDVVLDTRSAESKDDGLKQNLA